jgi:chromosome segregation protein
MIDHFLVASPDERKEFFDEATGVKEFQLKRHHAVLKLNRTEENIREVQMIVTELEPHLKSLKRQVNRLEQREAVEKELKEIEERYYGTVWHDMARQHKTLQKQYFDVETERVNKQKECDAVKESLHSIEKEEVESEDIIELQRQYEDLSKQGQKLREELTRMKNEIELRRFKHEQELRWEAMPLSKIVEHVATVSTLHGQLLADVRSLKDIKNLPALVKKIEDLGAKLTTLLNGLQRPTQEKTTFTPDKAVQVSLEETQKAIVVIEEKLREISREMREQSTAAKEKKTEFFTLQRSFQEKQEALRRVDDRLNALRVELAKVDTRREALEEEMNRNLGERSQYIKNQQFTEDAATVEPLRARIFDLKNKLEMIGGIDADVVREYKEMNERYEFLQKQLTDLQKAMEDLYKVLRDLDERTKERRDVALKNINKDFDRFFKILFSGGKAELIPMFAEEGEEAVSEDDEESEEELVEPAPKNTKVGGITVLAGVDIKAIPPGKRITNLNTLSGGERAMTAIALICAIIYNNPSPFVVMDEVDAALDEANSGRFSHILAELATHSQFICITHNRATMQEADVLYGVTMGDEGVSHLLSLKLEQALAQAK